MKLRKLVEVGIHGLKSDPILQYKEKDTWITVETVEEDSIIEDFEKCDDCMCLVCGSNRCQSRITDQQSKITNNLKIEYVCIDCNRNWVEG